MTAGLSDMEFQLLRKYIEDNCGIEITSEKAYLIETRLSKILADWKLSSYGQLYSKIKQEDNEALRERIIDAITTNETLWFRDKMPWKVLEDLYLPGYIEALRSGEKNKIRIWSSAASTGQEAYSTAICIDNYLSSNNISDISLNDFEIIATDISMFALEIACKGRYDPITIMRGLDKSLRDKYFQNTDGAWEICPSIKKSVKFMRFNLQNSFALFGKFDLVFCRYVLIYFSNRLKCQVIDKLFHSLYDNGVLFLGAYEVYIFLRDYFASCLYENFSYYTKLKEQGGQNGL